LTEAGVTVNCPDTEVPVPVNETEELEFDPVEVMARVPVSLPADGGANEALKVTLCAGARVSGRLIPLTLNPVPVGLI